MLTIPLLTKASSVLAVVVGLVAFLTPYWIVISIPPSFSASFGIVLFAAEDAGAFVISAYPISGIPPAFLVADIFFAFGFLFLIASVIHFSHAHRFFNIQTASQRQKLHRQSLGYLVSTVVLLSVSMIVIVSLRPVAQGELPSGVQLPNVPMDDDYKSISDSITLTDSLDNDLKTIESKNYTFDLDNDSLGLENDSYNSISNLSNSNTNSSDPNHSFSEENESDVLKIIGDSLGGAIESNNNVTVDNGNNMLRSKRDIDTTTPISLLFTAAFGFSFYLGWGSLLLCLIALTLNAFDYKRANYTGQDDQRLLI